MSRKYHCDRCDKASEKYRDFVEVNIEKYEMLRGWRTYYKHLCHGCYKDFERFMKEDIHDEDGADSDL